MYKAQEFFKILNGIVLKYSKSGIDRYIRQRIQDYYITSLVSTNSILPEHREMIENCIRDKMKNVFDSSSLWSVYTELIPSIALQENQEIFNALQQVIRYLGEAIAYTTNDLQLLPPVFSSITVSDDHKMKTQDEDLLHYLDIKVNGSFGANNASADSPRARDTMEQILSSRGKELPSEPSFLILTYSEFYISTGSRMVWIGDYNELTVYEQETLLCNFSYAFKTMTENILAQLSNMELFLLKLKGTDYLQEVSFLAKAAQKLEHSIN